MNEIKTEKDSEWVQIGIVIFKPEQRVAKMPEDTKKTPYLMYARGFLVEGSGVVGEPATIRTLAGRILKGTLEIKDPIYEHSFGRCVKELVQVGKELNQYLIDNN